MIHHAPMLLLFALFLPIPTHAQQTADFYTPLAGSIDAPGATESWSFIGAEGAVVSVLIEAEGSFDPRVTLTSSAGRILIANDDFAYPGRRDSLLQAITLPRTDTYTLTIAGFGDTVGAYTLTLFHGYAAFAGTEDFESDNADWSAVGSALNLDGSAGRLTLGLEGVGQSAFASGGLSLPEQDFYARVELSNISGRNGWIVGFVLRHQGGDFYRLALNDSGQWRLTHTASGVERVVRDWTNHPAIRAGETDFSLGVLANGGGFDAFYNNFYIGQAVDEQYTPPESPASMIGVMVGTASTVGSATVAEYDNLIVTQPLRLGESEIIPDQLMAGGVALTMQELQRRRVAPVGGAQTLTVTESSGQLMETGVQRVMLARGTTFGALVMGTSFTVSAGDGTVGCGVVFGHTDEGNYTLAFLDKRGGYGISTRQSGTFQPGLFGESANPAWREGLQEVLVVRLADRAYLYINRQYVGMEETALVEGEVGNAVVNYDPISTSCRFTNTWVWRWE